MNETISMKISNELHRLFDTLLSAPGMQDKVKVHLATNRKNVLLLQLLLEQGLGGKEGEKKPAMIAPIAEEDRQSLVDLSRELLRQAGLVELHEKLQAFQE